MIKNLILAAQTEWEILNENTRRQILGYDDQIMMVKVEFDAGAIGYIHQHEHRQTTYVVSGIFEFTVGDQTSIVKQGDALYMQPNVPHGVKCIEKGILIDTFTPARQDFIQK